MRLPNRNNYGRFDHEQDHARLVIEVLGLDIDELAAAFAPASKTQRPPITPHFVAYRHRVLRALRTARVDGKGLSYLEISHVVGGMDKSSIRKAVLASNLTESEIRALQFG